MRHMRKRQQSGQSVVLLAFLILVIVAMVGLSVDVGNAYGQQRRVQSISNAGAMAAMASVLANNTNNGVWTDVQRALTANRALANNNYTYTVDYILDDGTVELLGEWNGSMAYLPAGNSYPPSNIARVQVTMSEKVATRFAGVVGRESLAVNANGVACLGDYGFGVYPMGVPNTLRPGTPGSKTPGHDVFLSNGQKLPESDSRWGQWSDMRGMTIRIPVDQDKNDFVPGVHMSWLNWGGDTQVVDGVRYEQISGQKGTSDLVIGFTEPGTLQNGFLEAASPDSARPNTKPIGTLQRGDWISGNPGVKAGVKDALAVLMSRQTKLILPIYDDGINGGKGSKIAYHMVNMGYFVVRGVQLTGQPKYVDLLYLGDASASPAECGSEAVAGWSQGGDKQFNVKGEVKTNNRVWRTWASGSTTYDIVIVMDTSFSMYFDWNDRKPGQNGYNSANARIHDARKAVTDFVKGYDVSPTTGDPDARIAFVTFGGTTAGNYDYARRGTTPQGFNPAPVQVNWSTACAAADIANNCDGASNKWAPIQSKANSVTPAGVTPGPIAFEVVETLLQQKRTPPAGKKYGQIVIFATDGVFNVCGRDGGVKSCPYGAMVPQDGSGGAGIEYYLYNSGYNAVSGRPIWQAQQVANRIRNSGARIFVVALTPTCLNGDDDCFDPAGLMDMSNGANYYYQANDASAMANIYDTIREKINLDTCVPHEITQQAANATVVLTKPDNPTWSMQTVTDSSGAFQFSDLQAGQYIVKVDPALSLKSPEDGLTRTYSRIRNGRSLSEEGQASVYINPQFPNGATVSTQLLLSLPIGDDGRPHNGCTMPTP